MQEYTRYKRGSEWRRWDIHIHTPETKKNDQFEGSTAEEKWQKYIDSINCCTEDVSVVGITDYLSVDNYFKFKKFIEANKVTKPFDLIIPNIELRVTPVTKSATPINIHCLFNPEIDSEIETRFLSKLEITYGDSTFSAHKSELVRLGRSIPGCSNLPEEEAYKKGLEQYVISIDSLRKIFEKDETLRENTIIIVSNSSKDGVSGIRNHADYFTDNGDSQLDITRWSIYQFSDAIFSSNPKDILYFIGDGPDKKEAVIEKCKSLMPCFHGCDAHSNEKVFKPDDNRFCWVKADPTFEGFKQTIYEPSDRVKIQSFKPEIKNDRFVISEIQFVDDGPLFGNQKLLLNDNLNAIIGGKSSGKSLLLNCIARSIDPDQVDRTAKRLGFEGYKFDGDFNFEVTWKDGDKNILEDKHNKNKKIIYIPQLYVNHLVEKDKEDLNKLIESILLQDIEFKTFYQQQQEQILKISENIESEITRFLQLRNKGISLVDQQKQTGTSDSINKSIKSIQSQIEQGQKQSNFSKEEFETYTQLIKEQTELDKELAKIIEKEKAAGQIYTELEDVKKNLFGDNNPIEFLATKGTLFSIIDNLSQPYEEIIDLVEKVLDHYDSLLSFSKQEIDKLEFAKSKRTISENIAETILKLSPFQSKLKEQESLTSLAKNLEAENSRLSQALQLERQIEVTKTEYNSSRQRLANYLKERFAIYNGVVSEINKSKSEIGSDIKLECRLNFPVSDLKLLEQTNKAAIAYDNVIHTLYEGTHVKYDEVIKLLDEPVKVNEGVLTINKNVQIPVRKSVSLEDVIRGIAKDCFTFDYSVTYRGDNLLSMSPGKKGTVLLILFLQISSSEYPILIDQPEDNLDNRTIYDLLCKIIKAKKKERQIIIVSHNANLVVTTDAENIIVANQKGENKADEGAGSRFQYVNGSLEHSFDRNDKIKSELLCQGIREHVCDILEGGDEAFKQRERKYSIK